MDRKKWRKENKGGGEENTLKKIKGGREEGICIENGEEKLVRKRI